MGSASPIAAAGPDAAVVLEDVEKRFGPVVALQGIGARIESGRLTGVVGPDGAGKTTLMRLMAGLMAPSGGSIRVGPLDSVRDSSGLADVVGYMPQRFGLYEDLSVIENLRLYADLRGIDRAAQAQTFARLLDFTQLGPFERRLAGRLSGGMKQKLGLSCALMGTPDVLLLDEPGVGVDPISRRELWRMVRALARQGMAVVWATAYLEEAEQCEHVLLLSDGRLRYQGTPGALTARLAGRSFSLSARPDERRALLSAALDLPAVCDGVIQGDTVRVVLRERADPGSLMALPGDARVSPVAARFEDAFVDLLGGGPGGRSVIAEKMEPVAPAAEFVVEADQLTRRFGSFTAADRVSFAVRPGEIFGLLGPNGAGKSTTFKMLCGLLRPTSGQARVMGVDLRHAASRAKLQIGYMAQKFSLYGLLSVQQNLQFSAGVYGLEAALKRARIAEMIDAFELTPFLDSPPDALPLGFKQRLALACALMHRPPVLFLDEPTSGVDPLTRREFWTHINGLVRRGVTVLVTTHFMDEAEYCDRVALMYRAELIALDTPDALKARARQEGSSSPTMEDAFIHLIEEADRAHAGQVSA
jgi:ABC-2 type transport system ATP-binding protein